MSEPKYGSSRYIYTKYAVMLDHLDKCGEKPDAITKTYLWFKSKGLHRHISEWEFIKELLEAGLDPDKLI